MNEQKYCVENYSDVLLLLLCSNPNKQCFFGEYESCSNNDSLVNGMEKVFEKNHINKVSYKHWGSKSRAALETVRVPVKTFIPTFEKSRKLFIVHSFIADQQSSYHRFLKNNLQDDRGLIVCDFAENYAFVIQYAVPGFHWNNNQATIFPMIFYYNDDGSIKQRTLVIISDCNKRDSVAAFVFLKIFNEFLLRFRPIIKNCICFSDGAPQQFKNSK